MMQNLSDYGDHKFKLVGITESGETSFGCERCGAPVTVSAAFIDPEDRFAKRRVVGSMPSKQCDIDSPDNGGNVGRPRHET